jgi:kumamolisin
MGPADPNETLSVSIYVRPHPDAPPLPDLEHWMSPRPRERAFLTREEFANRHGAAQADLDRVSQFARSNGLTVVEIDARRR